MEEEEEEEEEVEIKLFAKPVMKKEPDTELECRRTYNRVAY